MSKSLPVIRPPYDNLDDFYKSCVAHVDRTGDIVDHMLGFDSEKRNHVLDYLEQRAKEDGITLKIFTDYYPVYFGLNYKNLIIDARYNDFLMDQVMSYTSHPSVNFKNFICSFNGSNQVGRQLLVALLKKYKWFNNEYCSQCFDIDPDKIDGYIQMFVPAEERLYRKLFIPENILEKNVLHELVQFDHASNIKILETELTQSFLHLVSESIATSYCPSTSEKILYSIATRGLFLAFAGPGWHEIAEKAYGFKLYNKLFDYTFDKIENPVVRLVELTSMISKFSHLSMADLHDLYLMELDSINYNYDHYFSGDWKKDRKAACEQWHKLRGIPESCM